MGLQYKAAVLHAPKTSLVVETIEAEELKADDVLVRIKAVGLCHTDLEVIEGVLRNPMPIVLGHEAAGIVEQVGPQARGVAVGDQSSSPGIRIAVIASIATATCRSSARIICAKDRSRCSSMAPAARGSGMAAS